MDVIDSSWGDIFGGGFVWEALVQWVVCCGVWGAVTLDWVTNAKISKILHSANHWFWEWLFKFIFLLYSCLFLLTSKIIALKTFPYNSTSTTSLILYNLLSSLHSTQAVLRFLHAVCLVQSSLVKRQESGWALNAYFFAGGWVLMEELWNTNTYKETFREILPLLTIRKSFMKTNDLWLYIFCMWRSTGKLKLLGIKVLQYLYVCNICPDRAESLRLTAILAGVFFVFR
jgi:hypothetical protein